MKSEKDLILGGKLFTNRLFIGTGKFLSMFSKRSK